MSSKYQNAKKYFITTKRASTLDHVIREYLPSVEVDTLIKSGGIWRNRQRMLKPDEMINQGDTLIVYVAPDQGRKFVLNPASIVKETDDWLIIDKPAAVTVAQDRSNTTYNLTFGVGEYLKSKGINYSPSPITRLDFMVQGLVIYPKSKASEITLFKAMMAGNIHKTYAAALPAHDPVINDGIVRDKIGFKGKTVVDPEGKEAISKFQFLYRENGIDYYKMMPITGKRHQLRFHAARYLKPLIGDALYGSKIPRADEHIALIAIHYDIILEGVTHTIELPDWQGKLSLLSGKNLDK